MMKVEQTKTPDDIERYIEGCLNDFESAISTKDETVVFLAELVLHIYKEAKKEQCNIADVVGQSEQYHCELYDFGRKDKPCDKQCDGCKAMNLD